MNPFFKDYILALFHARSIVKSERIQTLWSGYGEILRIELDGAAVKTIVVK